MRSPSTELLMEQESYERARLQEQKRYIQEQYAQIRPFCPVCMVRHIPQYSGPSETVSAHGVYCCDLCVNNNRAYPVPVFLLER